PISPSGTDPCSRLPTSGPRASPMERSVPMHRATRPSHRWISPAAHRSTAAAITDGAAASSIWMRVSPVGEAVRRADRLLPSAKAFPSDSGPPGTVVQGSIRQSLAAYVQPAATGGAYGTRGAVSDTEGGRRPVRPGQAGGGAGALPAGPGRG